MIIGGSKEGARLCLSSFHCSQFSGNFDQKVGWHDPMHGGPCLGNPESPTDTAIFLLYFAVLFSW